MQILDQEVVTPFLPEMVQAQIKRHSTESGHRLSDEVLQALHRSGYFKMLIPTEFGGMGANLRQLCQVQKVLGSLHPSLAIATAMHQFTVGTIVDYWQARRDMSWMLLQVISDHDAIVASAFGEPNLGGCLVRSNTRGVKVPGGYRLSGTKVPCSLAARAKFVCLHAQIDDHELIVGLLPSSSPGFEVSRGPDFMGMSASESDRLVLTDCFLPNQLVMHRSTVGDDQSEIFSGSLHWFCLVSSAVYIGLAHKAFEVASKKLAEANVPTSQNGQSKRSEMIHLQTRIGEAYSQLVGLDSALNGLADSKPDLIRALALKQETTRTLPKVMSTLMELCGGSTFSLSDPLNRLFRDAQAIQFHPPTPLWTDRILGSFALNGSLDFDFTVKSEPQKVFTPALVNL